MNHEHLDPDLESLEPPFDAVVEAIRAEQLPEDVIERIKNRAKQLQNPSTVTTVMPGRTERKWTASRFAISGLSIAAAILIAVAGVALLINRSSSRAFAQVIEKVKAIRSVRFTTSMQLGQQRKVDGQMYFEGKRQRFEQFKGKLIQIADHFIYCFTSPFSTSILLLSASASASVSRTAPAPTEDLSQLKPPSPRALARPQSFPTPRLSSPTRLWADKFSPQYTTHN